MLLNFAVWSVVSYVVLMWERLPPSLRAWTPRLILVAAIACAGVAPLLQGGYDQEVVLFIGGPNPYQVETVSRTWTGLAFGIALAFGALWALARWGLPFGARTPYSRALRLTLVILVLRIYLEKLGVPPDIAMSVGIIWLIVPLAVYFGAEAARVGSQKLFWGWSFGYTYSVRLGVLALMVVVTRFRLGTHFDNSAVTRYTVFGTEYLVEAGSWEQYLNLIVFPQMLLWPAVTLLAFLVIGLPVFLFLSRRQRVRTSAA